MYSNGTYANSRYSRSMNTRYANARYANTRYANDCAFCPIFVIAWTPAGSPQRTVRDETFTGLMINRGKIPRRLSYRNCVDYSGLKNSRKIRSRINQMQARMHSMQRRVARYTSTRKVPRYSAVKNGTIPHSCSIGT